MIETYNNRLLLLLSLVIITSGCINGGGGSDMESEAIVVEELSVEPSEIYQEGTVTVTVTIRNSGEIPALIDIGEDGTEVLTSHTPDLLRIEDFSSRTSTNPDPEQEYTLEPEEQLQMQWDLYQYDPDRIRFYTDDDASLTFRVPFQYDVNAFQQIQVKQSRNEQALDDLEAQSSQGPLQVALQPTGSSSESGNAIFLEEDTKQIQVQLYNQNPEEGAHDGLIRTEVPEIEGVQGLEIESCDEPEDDELSLYDGDSTVITCNIELADHIDDDFRSMRGEIRVSTEYDYIQRLGQRAVTVNYRG